MHVQERRGPANEDAEKALSVPRYGLQRVIKRLFPDPRVKPRAVLEREAEEEREARRLRREEVGLVGLAWSCMRGGGRDGCWGGKEFVGSLPLTV